MVSFLVTHVVFWDELVRVHCRRNLKFLLVEGREYCCKEDDFGIGKDQVTLGVFERDCALCCSRRSRKLRKDTQIISAAISCRSPSGIKLHSFKVNI